jgi:hypothetical protein
MSLTPLTVPGMYEPPSWYDITVRVAAAGGRQPDPAAFAIAASQAAVGKNATVVTAHGSGSHLRGQRCRARPGLPYTARRDRLDGLGVDTGPIRTPPRYPGGAADVLAASAAYGLERVVGKLLGSAYHPGQRRDWIKVKNTRHADSLGCNTSLIEHSRVVAARDRDRWRLIVQQCGRRAARRPAGILAER